MNVLSAAKCYWNIVLTQHSIIRSQKKNKQYKAIVQLQLHLYNIASAQLQMQLELLTIAV